MRTPYTCALLAFMAPWATGFAQTITNDNFTPTPGTAVEAVTGGYLPPGAGGSNQTWNFSALAADGGQSYTFVTPASTGQAASFPGSTVAQDAGAGNYAFYIGSAAGYDLAGVYSSALGSPIVYQNPERLFAYPCSFNSTWTDPFSANFTSFGTAITRSGTITGTADGFGTIVMPYGTVSNVLRVRLVEDYSDALAGVGNIEYDYTTYHWVKPGLRVPVLTLNVFETASFGEITVDSLATWAAASMVGLEETIRNAIGVELFPNPATDQVFVTYGTEGGSLQLELIDATGRLVRSEGITAAMGIGQHVLDLNGIPAGLYQVRITATNGQSGVQRLVVR